MVLTPGLSIFLFFFPLKFIYVLDLVLYHANVYLPIKI